MDNPFEKLITDIIDIEWEMFYSTRNVGGQASCQQDKSRFVIMRKAQFLGWNEESLQCYRTDLRQAESAGENLVTLKYAYMMKSTDPAGYKTIEERLPKLSPEKEKIVEELVALTVAWCGEFALRYPKIASKGRPVKSSEDSLLSTSVETYSRGELSSYGMSTLIALKNHYVSLREKGLNFHKQAVEREMLLMGAGTLEDIEKRLGG